MTFLPRLSGTGSVALLLLALVFLIAPAQVPVIILKLALVTLAAFAGYWIDRELFSTARPHAVDLAVRHHAWYRRAIIVAAVLAAVAFGL